MNCGKCNKELMIHYECKCNKVFCRKHKFPEDHNCKYNFKKDFEEKLKINNPKIINNKFEKRLD